MSTGPSFKVIADALEESTPQLTKIKNWRTRLRARIGDRLEEIMYELAEGRAWIPTLPDGSISSPLVPSGDVRLRAAIALKEMLDGRAVPQTEVIKAEMEAQDMESIRALSDAELEAEARKILESRQQRALNPGPVTDAEIVPDDLALQIWNAPAIEEP